MGGVGGGTTSRTSATKKRKKFGGSKSALTLSSQRKGQKKKIKKGTHMGEVPPGERGSQKDGWSAFEVSGKKNRGGEVV